jgi:hypothetical protein
MLEDIKREKRAEADLAAQHRSAQDAVDARLLAHMGGYLHALNEFKQESGWVMTLPHSGSHQTNHSGGGGAVNYRCVSVELSPPNWAGPGPCFFFVLWFEERGLFRRKDVLQGETYLTPNTRSWSEAGYARRFSGAPSVDDVIIRMKAAFQIHGVLGEPSA